MGKLTSYLGPTITRDQGHQHGINLLSDRIPCPCSHLSNQALREGGVAILFYHDTPPLPNQIKSAAGPKRGELPSGVSRPDMIHCLADPEEVHRKKKIAVAMVITGLEDMKMHFLLRHKS